MDLKLRGKRALVTGSSRGIGRSIALSLADFKVDVAINYLRHRSRAEETAQEIRDRGVRALLVKGNVADPEDVAQIFASIRAEWGGLDIVISNAASGVLRPARELTLHHFDWAMHINAAALLPLTQNLLEMPSDGEKVMVAVSSLGATRAIPNYTAVGASKAALESMVRHLAAEFAPEGMPSGWETWLDRSPAGVSVAMFFLRLFLSAVIFAAIGALGGVIGASLFGRKPLPPQGANVAP